MEKPLFVSEGNELKIVSFNVFQSKLAPYYAIAKAGLDQFTRALAIDLIEQGVRVNGVR